MVAVNVRVLALSVLVSQLGCGGSDESGEGSDGGTAGSAGVAGSSGTAGSGATSGSGATGGSGATSGSGAASGSGASGGTGGSSGSGTGGALPGKGGSGGGSSGSGGGLAGSPGVPVACDGATATALPQLPELSNVTARIAGKRARLNFDAFAGARDYRAYVLPADADVSAGAELSIRNATYRCAGETVARNQSPVLGIEWPTVESGSVVVVEALDQGCPFTGHLSYKAVPGGDYSQPFITKEESADPSTGEIFINGQFEPDSRPQPIARTFVCMEPGEVESMDFFEDFSDFDQNITVVQTGDHGYQDVFMENDSFEIAFQFIEPDVWSIGAVDGQLWVAYADWAADTASKFRATTRASATVADDTFVHATMAVDAISTHRRYPQLWLSTAEVPVQNNLDFGVTLNLESFGGVPNEDLLLQVCDRRSWDVQEQCPTFYDPSFEDGLLEWEEHTAIGLPVRYDVFLSSSRVYVFYDYLPAYCANLPEGAFNAGDEVKLTIGDVLYHSGVDEAVWESPGPDVYRFISEYQPTETRRTFDDVGLSGGVAAPEWDEDRMPCASDTYDP